jgi:hypothetical protein
VRRKSRSLETPWAKGHSAGQGNGLAVAASLGGAAGAALKIPSELRLPQTCKYLPPHEDFGTVALTRNDESSLTATGLEGADGPVVLRYAGSYVSPNGQVRVFLKDDSGLPPEVKALDDGGDTVFYGDTWGYEVHCDAANE